MVGYLARIASQTQGGSSSPHPDDAVQGGRAMIQPEMPASAIVVTRDSAFICRREEVERHPEVRVDNVEEGWWPAGFCAVAKVETAIEALTRRLLDAGGRTEDTTVTASTDGGCGLRRVLAEAGVTTTH
jgi:hypothetical protein